MCLHNIIWQHGKHTQTVTQTVAKSEQRVSDFIRKWGGEQINLQKIEEKKSFHNFVSRKIWRKMKMSRSGRKMKKMK